MSRLAAQVMRGTWRGLPTGVNVMYDNPELADGATDQPGDTGAPIETEITGGAAMVLPWFDALEDPDQDPGLFHVDINSTSYHDSQIAGAMPIVGAYEPAVKTRGPVRQWGHEVSGGLTGDQEMARIMRFPANIPERYDPNGVWNIDYADELAEAIASNGYGTVTEQDYTTQLLLLPGIGR